MQWPGWTRGLVDPRYDTGTCVQSCFGACVGGTMPLADPGQLLSDKHVDHARAAKGCSHDHWHGPA